MASGTIGGFIAKMVISILVSAVASAMMAPSSSRSLKKRQARQRQEAGQSIKGNTCGTNIDLKIIYGQARIGANRVYASITGAHSKKLYFAHVLCEGENEGVVNDGNPVIWFGGERIHEKYLGTYSYNEKKGSATQIQDTLINAALSEFTDPMRYTAYVAWELDYDENKYRGIPEIHYLYKGRLLEDFRNSPSTIAWSDNPVLALYDYYTNSRYGANIDPSEIDLTSWGDAADYCDAKGFTINLVITDPKRIWDNIENMLDLFRGSLNYWNGQYYLRYKDLSEESSVMTIEDKHIYQRESGQAQIKIADPGYYDIPRGVRVTYMNAENNQYVKDSFIVGETDGTVNELDLLGCADREMAGVLALSELERAQVPRVVSGRFRDDCLLLEPNDIVTLNTTALGISDQVMRVVSTNASKEGFIDLSLQYESEDIYDDIYNINTEAIYQTLLPDPQQYSLIENADVTETTYDFRLRTFSKLDVTFNVPEDTWFKEVEVYVSTNGDVEANYKHQFNSKSDFSIDPVSEGDTYYIILRTVNIWDTKQPLAQGTKLSKAVIGKSSTRPDSLTSIEVISGDGSVSIRGAKLSDPDIEIYEFRLGTQWTGGVLLSQKRAPVEELSLVRPGNITFWCNTVDTNGLYGDTPQGATITVPLTQGWSAYTTFFDDYTDTSSGQTVDNVEHITYSSEDWLKCSHVGSLSGQWISEEFDTGVVAGLYFVYVDTEITTVGTGTTWGDLFPSGETWGDVNADTRSWLEMFEIEEAPQVTIRIYYKSEATHDWSYIEAAQVLAGVVTGRYFKVEINIEDPSSAVNAYVKEYTLRLYN